MRTPTLLSRLALGGAIAAATGCQAPPPGAARPTFELPPLAQPGAAAPTPIEVAGSAPPAAAPGPPAPEAPAVPAAGAGGASGAGVADAPPLELKDVDLSPDPSGGWALPAPVAATVTLVAPGHVLSTIVLSAGSGVTALHPTPLDRPATTGLATVKGQVDAAGGQVVVSFRAPGLGAFYGQEVAADGSFEFQVPVDAPLSGVVVAVDRSETPPVALSRVTLTAGATTDPILLVRQELLEGAYSPPALPGGMARGPSRLTLLDGASRLDLAAFSVPRVPRYDISGFALGAVFEAEAPGGLSGSEIVAGASAAVPAFLPAPELSGLPAQLAPGAMIRWPSVPGATLYTLRLRRAGEGAPVWEGASPAAQIRLPVALPAGLSDLALEVEAWASADVTTYAVAGLRALRIPPSPQAAGGRRSWTLRRGLATGQPPAAGG